MIKVIVFDMDGTLINSDELVISIYRKLVSKFPPNINFEGLNQDEVLSSSYPDILFKLYGESHHGLIEEIHHIHQELKHQYLFKFNDVDKLLTLLKTKGFKLGILTSEIRSIAIDELNMLNLYDYFDHVVCFEDLINPKPHQDGLLNHLNYFHCTNEEIIYIGDQKTDGIAANQAHIYSILLDRMHQKTIDVMRVFDHIAHDIENLMKYIDIKNKHIITMKDDQPLKIVQFTDFHLMNDERDIKTFALIDDIIMYSHPDFIVLTGDQTMSKDAVKLYQKLGEVMDNYKIPYTFVFGNHDVEGNYTYQDLIDSISSSKYLWFDQGPKYLGYSNQQILIQNHHKKTISSLLLLDTHIDEFYLIDNKKTWGYGSISKDQIAWYKRCIQRHPYPHLIFFHIPIPEMNEVAPDDDVHHGDYYEKPSTPPVQTGFFETTKHTNIKHAMFFGHDHLNDFVYEKDKTILAYGRVSGHYDYAMPGFPKGARIITLDQMGNILTQVILHQDIQEKSS